MDINKLNNAKLIEKQEPSWQRPVYHWQAAKEQISPSFETKQEAQQWLVQAFELAKTA